MLTGLLEAGCTQCHVRDLARGPLHAAARAQRRITTPYKAALVALGGHQWQEMHELVKACYEADSWVR